VEEDQHPLVAGPTLELQRCVGDPAEGYGEPEVDGPVGQDGREGLGRGRPEAGDHRHQDELDHAQAPGGYRDGGQDVGQPIGHQQIDRGDEVTECGDEHPERGGIEQPVGRRPSDGPAGQGAVPHERGEPVGQPLHQGGGPVSIEEPDPVGHPADDPAGPLLTSGQQVEQPAERTEEDHPDPGSHDDQDRRRSRLPAVMAGRGVEAVGDEEAHQGAPEHGVEHHRRTDALGPEGEPGVRSAHPGLGEQAVAKGGAGGGAPGGDVAEGQRGHVDPEQPEPPGAVVGEHGVGQLGVRGQGAHLQQQPEGEVAQVDVGQRADVTPVAGQEGQGHIEGEQEHQDGAHAQADLTTDERSPVPPPPERPGRRGCLIALHRDHVDTPDPLGPAMLAG